MSEVSFNNVDNNYTVSGTTPKKVIGKINISPEQLSAVLGHNHTSSSEVVSQKMYTYNNIQGTLKEMKDGSYIFESKYDRTDNSTDVIFVFRNLDELEKKCPVQKRGNTRKGNPKDVYTVDYKIKNGKPTSAIVKDYKNNVIETDKYNSDGKIIQAKRFANGKLQSTALTKYNKDGGKTVTVYDGKNKISQEINYDKQGRLTSRKVYDSNGQVFSQIDNASYQIDGNVGESAQIGEGDCYLMAAINGIRKAEGGQQLLNNLIKINNKNGQKTYTVTLPGAKLAAQGLLTEPGIDRNKMYITGTYTFTEAEIEKLFNQAGKKYSAGDGDVILLEAAFEKYRKEVQQTLDENPSINQKHARGLAGLQTGADNSNILAGGAGYDSMYILTGQTSKVYSTDNQRYGLDTDALKRGEVVLAPRPKPNANVKAAMPEIDGPMTSSQSELDRMLDQIMIDSKDGHIDNVATAGFRTEHSDGSPESGHLFTIKAVTKDTVVLVNPWFPDSEITMTREQFKQCANNLNIASKPIQQSQQPQILNSITTTPPVSLTQQQNDTLQAIINRLRISHNISSSSQGQINQNNLNQLLQHFNNRRHNNHTNIDLGKFTRILNNLHQRQLSPSDLANFRKLENYLNSKEQKSMSSSELDSLTTWLEQYED